MRQDHEVRLLTPYDPDDRLARVMHRGVSPERRPLPEYGISLGRTMGLPMNGAVSNLSFSTGSMGVLSHELRTGGYDVVHVHEPNVPVVSWFAVECEPGARGGHLPHLLHGPRDRTTWPRTSSARAASTAS